MRRTEAEKKDMRRTEQEKGMGGKRAKKGETNADAGGSNLHLHLDTRPIEAITPQNDVGKATQKLDTQVGKCKAGVAWIDLLKMAKRLKFGVYNDRAENEVERNKLIVSFQQSGIVSMKETSAIPIIIDMKRLKTGLTLSADFSEPDTVRELEILDQDKIIVASGQHRLAALKKYHHMLKDEYASLEKKRDKISGLTNVSVEHVTQWDDLREQMGVLLGKMENIGKWGVVVYNQSLLLAKGDTLAAHLSRNNSLHEYKETEEEVLITIFKKVLGRYKDKVDDGSPEEKALECLTELRKEQEKNTRLQRVLSNDPLCLLLSTELLPLGPHFRHRREYSVTWLSKSLDVCVGLYVAWIHTQCSLLRKLTSEEPFPDFKTIEELLDDVEHNVAGAAAKVKELREQIAGYTPEQEGDITIWAEWIGTFDIAARQAFRDLSKGVGVMTSEYIVSLSTYRETLIGHLRRKWRVGSTSRGSENKIVKHLDMIVARLLLVLTPDASANHAPEPLLGGMMLDYAWTYLTTVKTGIAEICRWFEALLDSWKVLHVKTHTMDDWSTVMLNNVKNDARFEGVDLRYEITNIIWTYRTSLVMRLNNTMTRLNRQMQPRPKDRKEFDALYDALPAIDKITSSGLTDLIGERRKGPAPRTRSMSTEPQRLPGMMALHVTSWDWQHPSLKNSVRDIAPVVHAITLERLYSERYRPELLRDGTIAALRRMLEMCLADKAIKQQTWVNMKLITEKRWKWWDGIILDESQEDPTKVTRGIHESFAKNAEQTQAKLALETMDREAITKAVSYISNMACAKAGESSHSKLSADVARPLALLVAGLELNSARLRLRHLARNNEAFFNSDGDVEDLKIELVEGVEDDNTLGFSAESAPPDNPDQAMTIAPSKILVKGTAKGKAKGKGKQKAVAPSSDDDPISPPYEPSLPESDNIVTSPEPPTKQPTKQPKHRSGQLYPHNLRDYATARQFYRGACTTIMSDHARLRDNYV
ncbi:hypothetical protein DEU56DRAFT_757826 [Suillus clintonianus]|uniref:uncharacterized protein n=1 Tax=Suillus clintonianus TaxID=1904413 RepID=UPI001B879A66|nr:uncharacterized protein DEU56DRAFT_757826 [Suillus clintonianus]KAG2130761.1 hypothetical protein DEU56DRAFT_757826 [Suillus clintonianus]